MILINICSLGLARNLRTLQFNPGLASVLLLTSIIFDIKLHRLTYSDGLDIIPELLIGYIKV
jgi:hypothetical protein